MNITHTIAEKRIDLSSNQSNVLPNTITYANEHSMMLNTITLPNLENVIGNLGMA